MSDLAFNVMELAMVRTACPKPDALPGCATPRRVLDALWPYGFADPSATDAGRLRAPNGAENPASGPNVPEKSRNAFPARSPTIAALYVQPDGCYANLPGVEVWDQARDARTYAGPYPVVAHPPCQRWGRYWHGSPRKPHQHTLGADEGCFAAALAAVRRFGGVLEHPAYSHAWSTFGLASPPGAGGWVPADHEGGWTCCVDQGHYDHISRKTTWLYAVGCDLPALQWGRSAWAPDPAEIERIGFRAAQRNGALSRPGLKNRAQLRAATPPAFRDVLLAMAATALAPSLSGRT